MASSELHARRPLVVVLLSLVVLFALDAAIFRSGAYAKISSTKSVAGHFAAVARWGIALPPSPKRDVLVLGHSKIEAALSAKIFDQENPDSHLRLVFGSSGGTTEKMWFYMLEHLDPSRDKYTAIIIPIDSYQTQPVQTDCENAYDVAQFLAPILETREWPDFVRSYTDADARSKVILGAIVSSHFYAVDVQDLLLHPIDRYDTLEWTKKVAPTFLYDFDGFEGDLSTLEIDPKAGKILHAPDHLDPFRRAEAEGAMRPLPEGSARIWTARYHAFRKQWLGRIASRYEGSPTRVVFVQVPRWPFRMAGTAPIDGAPDLREYIKPSENVVVVNPDEFMDLEKPEYFFDVFHVNKVARRAFTVRFAKVLRRALGDLPP